MDGKTYDVRLRRRKGRWLADVPELPADAPVLNVSALGDVAAEMITELSLYLGVPASMIDVRVPHPTRRTRVPLRQRLTHGVVQAAGGTAVLSGVYLAAGLAATLITAGVGIAAVATGKEAGWL